MEGRQMTMVFAPRDNLKHLSVLILPKSSMVAILFEYAPPSGMEAITNLAAVGN